MDNLLPATETPSPGARRKRGTGTGIEQSRKRVARALKEKCDSVQPCARCVRTRRRCTFAPTVPRAAVTLDDHHGRPNGFFDADRIYTLERIVGHFANVTDFGKSNLIQLAESLCQQSGIQQQPDITRDVEGVESVSDDDISHSDGIRLDTATYPGELSHTEFSLRLQQKVESRLQENIPYGDIGNIPGTSASPSAIQVQSRISLVADAVKHFPPADIAHFLLSVFFDYAQTNYSYVDEQFLRNKLQDFYSSPLNIGNDDVSWICTVMMMFAIGTQFAHLSTSAGEDARDRESTSQTTDDQLALVFYRQASKLIPDVIAAASIESVQAFLLFAVYTLPIDAAGLSCVYLGIAIRIATQNGIHRNLTTSLDPKQIELRKRLWWTAYTLERRVCILHGRPLSITRSEVDCELPSGSLELRTSPSSDVMPNVLAMIRLTDMLESAKDKILDFKKASKKLRNSKIKLIELHKEELQKYWDSLPDQSYCRDLNPSTPLFRFNLHLALTFHLIHIFIGRSFILESQRPRSPADASKAEYAEVRDELVSDCIRSAIEVVNLCQTLHDEVGLARASYTEFTSCSAALLVVLARRISSGTTALQAPCDRGIKLLKKMSLGIYSNSDKLTVEALEKAIYKLQEGSQNTSGASGKPGRHGYAEFRNWAALQQSQPMANLLPGACQRGFLVSPNQNATNPSESVLPGATNFDITPDYEPLDLSDLVSVTGLDEIFRYGLQ